MHVLQGCKRTANGCEALTERLLTVQDGDRSQTGSDCLSLVKALYQYVVHSHIEQSDSGFGTFDQVSAVC